jgi:hypothetical protein
MDAKLVEEAIRKAITGGAAQARPNPLLPGDEERVQTDVEIDPQVLEDYVADLRRDRQMARFDAAFVTVPTGYGAGTSLVSVARPLPLETRAGPSKPFAPMSRRTPHP